VKIRSRLPTEDPALQADPILLQQVLLNLLRNGMDAMAATPPEQREILVTTERTGPLATVLVSDRGCGLSPQVREQLSSRSSLPRPRAWAWGSTSAARSWSCTAAAYGQSPTPGDEIAGPPPPA